MNTVKEWSDAFDVLYNQVMSNAAAALDEYDKSIFLTKAQEEIVKNYFNPKGNKYQEGYDDSAKRQADFATLMEVAELETATGYQKFDSRSASYKFPVDFFIAVNEQYQVTVSSGNDTKIYPYTIVPLSYTDYARVMQKPYKYPPKSQVWRLIVSEDNQIPIVEIIGRYNPAGTGKYLLRYVKRPNPIILVDLSTVDNNLSINGVTGASNCELPEHIHEEILQRAVELAKAAYASDQNGTVQLNNQVQIGQRSE